MRVVSSKRFEIFRQEAAAAAGGIEGNIDTFGRGSWGWAIACDEHTAPSFKQSGELTDSRTRAS